MALQAHHHQFHHFPPPRLVCTSRDSIINGATGMQDMYPNPTFYGSSAPPMETAVIQSETNDVVSMNYKRSRDDDHPSIMYSNNCYSFLGEDFSSHFLQHQLEIDHFILHQTENLRRDIQRQLTSRVVAADIQSNMAKKLKSKDDQLEKIGKLNSTLEERLKSLYVENQILKELAQTNEATANVLRCNLEQVLQIQNKDENGDDAELSRCGSSSSALAEENCGSRRKKRRVCRRCGERETTREVVVLPCRHLCCECTACASSTNTCPVCNLLKTATLHLNHLPSS